MAATVAAAAAAAVAVWALGGWAAMFSGREAVPSFHQVTYRRGAVSSARFTPEGQSFVYSASWDGQPWNVFLGRAQSPDARNLSVDGARILSISSAGDMAVLFAPQNIVQAFGARTLARIPMAGGARRDLVDGVVDADWIPGTDSMAVVRDPGGGRPWIVEFPAGTPVHEAPAAWSLRVSPDGSRVAFFEGPGLFGSAPLATITVVDRAGKRSTVARNWAGIGLAWTPRGDEIWFTAARAGDNGPQLHAVSLSGAERTVHRAPDWLVLHDIAEDGRALLSRNSIRISMSCKPKGQPRETDLGWLTASFVSALSADGANVAFFDGLTGLTSAGHATVFFRKLDGSPAVAMGEGTDPKISPDGQWILVTQADNYFLLPTGVGSIVKLPKGDLTRVLGAAWLGDSKRIVFAGIPPAEKRARGYIQEIPAGIPRALTPPAVWLSGSAATIRNDQSVLGLVESDGRWMLYPLGGGSPQPVPGLTGNDIPVQWSANGLWLYTVGRAKNPLPPSFDIFRIELATGRRALWKTLSPYDTAGVEAFPGLFAMTPDAETYCYSYMRRLGDLFVVDGLR
jgi:eukaryotic-like serine/threonine-protein kinase